MTSSIRLAKIFAAVALPLAFAACNSSTGVDEDAALAKYKGTVKANMFEYQTDTVVINDCLTQANVILNLLGYPECGEGEKCDSTVTTNYVRTQWSGHKPECSAAGGKRDTLYITRHFSNTFGWTYSADTDREIFDMDSTDQDAFRSIALLPYQTDAHTDIQKNRVSDEFTVKAPNLKEHSMVVAECTSAEDGVTFFMDVTTDEELKEVYVSPMTRECEVGDKYEVTVVNSDEED